MRGQDAAQALPEPLSCRRQFDRAARSFTSAAFIHDEARRHLLERVDDLSLDAVTCVDLGAALGHGAAALRQRFPQAQILAVDTSFRMLSAATPEGDAKPVVADAASLPIADGSIDLLFANLLLPWTMPDRVFAEACRVLSPQGAIVFSAFGPDSLIELRRAWSKADAEIHVHGFFDMQTLGDLAVGAGLAEPVLDVDRIRVSYSELSGVIRDLRACGATNTAAGRRRGLTGRGRWQRFVEAFWRDQGQGSSERLSLTVELIYGLAFGRNARPDKGLSPGETHISPDAIGGRSLGQPHK